MQRRTNRQQHALRRGPDIVLWGQADLDFAMAKKSRTTGDWPQFFGLINDRTENE
ncbi:MAG: hypothetical protein U0936_17580 [Planctomycetaceae bacterium]